MKTIRFAAVSLLLAALLGATGCTTQQIPEASASATVTPEATPQDVTGAVADPCKPRLISGYPAGSHAYPAVMLKLNGPGELEAAKATILGSARSENDKYGFAVTKKEFYGYLTDEEAECVNTVSGRVDYYLTNVNDAQGMIDLLQLGGASLFVSNTQSV